MLAANSGVKKVIIEAVITRADGTVNDLGAICDIEKTKMGMIDKIKTMLKK